MLPTVEVQSFKIMLTFTDGAIFRVWEGGFDGNGIEASYHAKEETK